MEQQATPSSSSKRNNGGNFVTPKNRKKSPGDILGSGKSQLPITRYYSPLSSSSDRSSQPYSPIACSSRTKRRSSTDSPLSSKRLPTKTALHSQKQTILIVSSDESSDEVFTNSQPRPPPVVSRSRLSHIKRRLYSSTSSPVSSGRSTSRPKKKLLPKRRSRVLSDSDSEGVIPTVPKRFKGSAGDSESLLPMESSKTDTKPLQDVVLPSQATQARRRLCPETSAQAILISSSDDSDFELHNSKQSQSFLSQSVCGKDAPQPNQRSSLSSQTNRKGYTKTVGSSFIEKPPTGIQRLPKKRCSLQSNSSDSASLAHNDNCDAKTSTRINGLDINIPSGRRQKASFERPPNRTVSPGTSGGEELLDDIVRSECVDDNPEGDGETQLPLIPVHNGDVSSIYLQDTIPFADKASRHPETDEADHPDSYKAQLGSSTEREFSRNSIRHVAVSRSPSPGDSIYNEKTIDPAAEDLDATVDISHKPLTSGMPEATALSNGLGMNPEATDHPDSCKALLSSSMERDFSRTIGHHGSTGYSIRRVEVSRSPSPGDSILYNEKTIDPNAAEDLDATVDISHKPLTNGMPKVTALSNDLGMDPEAAFDLDATVDISHSSLTNVTPNATGSANGFHHQTSLPGGFQKGAVIEPSDDEDESMVVQNHLDQVQLSENDRTSLGVIPISELMDVSHISGSDNSDLSDVVHSDDDLMIGEIGSIPGSLDALATHMSSLLVEGSEESSAGITSVMNSMMDASADFFSDVVASFEAGRALEELDRLEDGTKPGKVDFCQNLSPTEGIVDIALDVAALERASKSVDSPSPVIADKSDCSDAKRRVLSEEACVSKAGEASLIHNGERVTPTPLESCYSMSDVPANPLTDTDAKDSPDNAFPIMPDTEERTDMTSTKPDCRDARKITKPEEACGSKAEEVSLVHNEENVVPTQLQSCNGLPGVFANPVTDSCSIAATPDNAIPSMPSTEQLTDMTLTNGVPADVKVVCGYQPPEDAAKLCITLNVEKALAQNPNNLLLDTVITECRNYAEHVLSLEPIKSFVFQYSNLPQTSKLALHGCLLDLLEDSNRWVKYQEPSAGSINTLVCSGIFEYLNNNDNFVTKLNHLEFSEITDVLCKLGNSPSKTIETMRNIILNKFSSAYTCERVRKEIIDVINRKFVKLTESALFCIKICLELFVLPLNLCDKLYKIVEIARFADTLIRNVNTNRVLLLPLKTSKMIGKSDRVLRNLSEICRLKSSVFGSALNDESIYLRVNDIFSSIAVMDVSAEFDSSVKNSPTFRFLMTNYVHALDEQLKTLLYHNTSNIEFGACLYLAVLLQQNVTGFQHKVKWCRERMRYLEKLFDSANFFEEFTKVLKEPANPVQFIVRSEFVSNALKIKKYGLSPDEKSHIMNLLRPISHRRTPLPYMPLNSYLNYYTVLTRKPKGKNFNMVRANIFEVYKSDFPCGVEDNGSLLMNAIFLAFWQVIYQNIEGAFLNKFQNKPLDWGSEEFFLKREKSIKKLALEFENNGLPAVVKSINTIFEQFSYHRCVVDWQLVAPNLSKMVSIVEALGIDRFLKISVYLLGKLDERILGFPDIVLWNPESKNVKFLVLRKPNDQYPYQILWLEKLADFELDAEELQMSGSAGPEKCSQLK